MSITSGFFDSVDGDRTYDAEQMSNYFDGLVSNGVYESIGDRFLVTAGTGMAVNVGSGRAIINSRWVKNDGDVSLPIDPADSQGNRIDAVVLRLSIGSRAIELAIKKGTAVSGYPSIPEITRNADIYELYLASVLVPKSASQPSTITDLRSSTYCGWVTGIVQQVDTSDLFLQWQTAFEEQFAAFDQYMQQKEAAFNAWFETLTRELKVEAGITKVDRWVDIGGGSSKVKCPNEYEEGDVLLVFMDGKYLDEDTDYTFTTSPLFDGIGIKLAPALVPVTTARIQFVILKSTIGQSVITGGLPTVRISVNRPMIAGEFHEF